MNRSFILQIFSFLLAATLIACGPPPPGQGPQGPGGPGGPPPPGQSQANPNPQGGPPPATSVSPAQGQSSTSASNCPSSKFVSVSNVAGVVLNVTCTSSEMVVETNNMPNFQVPGTTKPELRTWYIPLTPQVASQPVTLPLGGPVAVAIDGIQIHGPNGADFDGYPDPVHEGMLVACGGHHANQTLFHFHARPDCLLTQLGVDTNDPTQMVGVVLAYAFDGYPILTPYICDNADCSQVKELESSWEYVSDVTNAWEANQYVAGSGDLDQCNGLTLPDGSYAYFATDGFPYLLGCYHGVPDARDLSHGPG